MHLTGEGLRHMAQAFAGEVHERSSASDFIERSNSALSGLLSSMNP